MLSYKLRTIKAQITYPVCIIAKCYFVGNL